MGVPIIRALVFWGLHWGPLILGNYHIGLYGDNGKENGNYYKVYCGFMGILEKKLETTM